MGFGIEETNASISNAGIYRLTVLIEKKSVPDMALF
jgi:hypothetical protein